MRGNIAALALVLCLPFAARGALPEARPESVGLDSARLARLDALLNEAVEAKVVPGAVAIVGRRGKIVYVKAVGKRSLEPDSEPMTRDTLFDMASLTKPVATATSIMILIEAGTLRLDDKLGVLLPEFDNQGKGAITLEQLLRHRSGLIADNPIGDYREGVEEAWKRLANLDLKTPPGTGFVYSDVNFITLGQIVEERGRATLDTFAQAKIFGPVGMKDTRFYSTEDGAPPPEILGRIAPTEPIEPGGTMLRGVVHDPRSRALGGVAGHAGLFSTADDIAIYAQTLLNHGTSPNGYRLLSPLAVRLMTDPADTPTGQRRGLGWDVATSFSAPRGTLFGPDGFGHTGFTGTSLWVDRETETFIVLLTSRLHPDGKKPAPGRLRSALATVVASAILDPPRNEGSSKTPGRVFCGIDIWGRKGYEPLKGKRVGLVTNHTGRTRMGVSTIDALFKAPEVRLVALFSPEHGIRGLVDAAVDDSRDEATGLPIFSLYGKTRKPSPDSLKDVDALVYDIQDIGARFYTYISTMGLALEAAKERGIPIYVLDRPNPIGGLAVAGPVRDEGKESFTAHHAIPVRHGMTVGELARLFNQEREIGADLHVIPCEGWSRGDLYDATGLLWVNPSPNMRSLTQALLYPGVGLLEASNLATGRGTDTPFERVGAPWIDPVAFAIAVNALELPGVKALPVRFTPKERQYANSECGGVYLAITDRDHFEPIALGFGLAHVLRTKYKEQWKPEGMNRLLADDEAYQAVLEGKRPEEVRRIWRDELAAFLKIRERYLIYP